MWTKYAYNAWSISLNSTDWKHHHVDNEDDDDDNNDQKYINTTEDTKFPCVFVW